MGKIMGFFHPEVIFTKEKGRYLHYLDDMTQAFETAFPHLIQKSSSFLSDHFGLAQTEFSSASLPVLPLIKRDCGQTFGIVLDGELYNAPELSAELTSRKRAFDPSSDADILLTSYLEFGPSFAEKLNGAFAFAIMDVPNNRLILYRDHAYTQPQTKPSRMPPNTPISTVWMPNTVD